MGAAPAIPSAPRASLRRLRALSDERLVSRVRDGDEAAFEAIYDRYHRQLLAFARHMVGTREEAEDVLQHTFLAAYRGLGASTRPMALKAWLFTIARNGCLSTLRARRHHETIEDAEPATEGLADEVERRADLRELLGDLRRLPDDQRAALVLGELDDLSHEEIGVILGVRTDKVKALVFQAREAIAGARTARDTPCAGIREQLATARGGALRRAPLRRHLAACTSCRAFRAEVQRQRAGMAILLPVLPSMALKSSVLGAVMGSGGAGAGGGVVAAGGLGALGAKAVATKALLAVALVGAAGGGAAAVHELRSPAPTDAASMAAGGARSAPAAPSRVKLRLPGQVEHGAATPALVQPAHAPKVGEHGNAGTTAKNAAAKTDKAAANRKKAAAKTDKAAKTKKAAKKPKKVKKPEKAKKVKGGGGNGSGRPAPSQAPSPKAKTPATAPKSIAPVDAAVQAPQAAGGPNVHPAKPGDVQAPSYDGPGRSSGK